METVTFNPGPTQLYPQVKNWLQEILDEGIGSWSHRSTQACELVESVISDVKHFFSIPKDWDLFFLSSATQVMESLLSSCVETAPCHFVEGAFAYRFYEIALGLGKEPYLHSYEPYGEISFPQIEKDPSLIAITLNETSSGVFFPYEQLRRLRQRYPQSLIIWDVVSAVPCYPLDFSLCDGAFFSVQKGFGMPAGLGVFMGSARLYERAFSLEKKVPQLYHSVANLNKMIKKFQTPSTPNLVYIALLGKVCRYLSSIGTSSLYEDRHAKAVMIEEAMASFVQSYPSVKDPLWKSESVLVFDVHDPSKILRYLQEYSIILGAGYENKKSSQIRIANFPMHTKSHIDRLVYIMQQLVAIR